MNAAKPMGARGMFDRRPRVATDASVRRGREDVAPRLHALVPTLVELRLEFEEHTDGRVEVTHTRRVVVENASSLILAGCSAWGCKGGGFEVSHGVLAALRQGLTEFEVSDSCIGHTRAAACQRRVRVRGFATYAAS